VGQDEAGCLAGAARAGVPFIIQAVADK